ncbi:hypothetical protein GCM10023185_37340 [Hymenobacter saemangeumensis]|uniref:Tn3 transposase DDE domain-containing protein n=1 Tax=Hymenobacter saemangeumensis TaxID=1084522 RepID=A0ABP8IQ98_9BACT
MGELTILRYLLSKPLRRKIHVQLNKGERLHALRVFLWFGGDGLIRRKQEEAQQEVVGALNLFTNLVVLWNTVYLQQVVQTLRAEGVAVRDEDLARLSPARYEHINRLGKYTFPPGGSTTQRAAQPAKPIGSSPVGRLE